MGKASKTVTPKNTPAAVRAAAITTAASSGINRFIPLNNGNHVYFIDPVTGRTNHYATSSQELLDHVVPFAKEGLGDRIDEELTDLDTRFPGSGWAGLRDRIRAGASEA